MSKYTLGSLFDGSGGFPLAGALCGIDPVWAAEIEPYPIAVTRSRFNGIVDTPLKLVLRRNFPNMKLLMRHLGDISKINGAEIEPVDIITFGSPCQDLSVAGKRAGLKHTDNGDDETTRSGLFMEAVRIVKEMREATNGKYPVFALWENVPGAFSSNKGEDFRVVLEELIKIVEPTASMPSVPQNGWPYADCYRGDGWSIAYRVLDAQYWGVPQRRRRVYLVADFRDECAGEVLFEREGLRGYFAESGAPWQGAAGDAERGTGADDRARECVAYGISSYESNAMKSANPHSGIYVADTSRTLDLNGGNPACNQGGIAIVEPAAYGWPLDFRPENVRVYEETATTICNGTRPGCTTGVIQPVYCLQGNMIGRADKNGPQGDGVNEDVSFTCNTTDRHAVAYLASGKETVGTLMANAGTMLWLGNQEAFSGDYHIVEESGHPVRYIVRRLTPTECARLQGFPDKWGHLEPKSDFSDAEYSFWLEVRNTHAAINGKAEKEYSKEQMLTWYNKLHTDSSEYKMWGNGIADALKGAGKAKGLSEGPIGYKGIGTESGKYVAAEDAREHVLKECGLAMQESTYLSEEAMDALVEWYFSGEWLEVREDE